MSPATTGGIISLLTDFGLRDGFIGVMKGVIAGIAPKATVIDISHDIAAQNIRSASFLLQASCRYFPEGSIHVAVVDPGVGSPRKGIVAFSNGHYYIGPDNGILTPALCGAEVRALENPQYQLPHVSSTFHGRDIFAPAAAWLAQGVALSAFGEIVAHPQLLPASQPVPSIEGIQGEIIHIDRFGNLITNFDAALLEREGGSPFQAVLEDGSSWPLHRTYSDVAPGKPCAVIGGFDCLELCISMGSAADKTGAAIGSKVWLKPVA